ncbi:hypothetical protein Ocin01_12191 [Orchesella cincta]|uniref:Uncharacterized protein n=1 Tax=Orchesella cincta TaxID=48709 RepID=A0A1D2MN85_ORCCI|nr:hypothetical protein Ocin01_12191 [Orchesella cincta]
MTDTRGWTRTADGLSVADTADMRDLRVAGEEGRSSVHEEQGAVRASCSSQRGSSTSTAGEAGSTVQLQVPASRLHHEPHGPQDGTLLLRAAQEVQPREHAARDPPRDNANVGVVRGKVHPGRSLDVLRPAEHVRAHNNVRVLHAGSARPRVPKVPLVEEAPDHRPDNPVHRDRDPLVPAALHRVQVPESVRVVDRLSRVTFLGAVFQILQGHVHRKSEATEGGEGGEGADPAPARGGEQQPGETQNEQELRRYINAAR